MMGSSAANQLLVEARRRRSLRLSPLVERLAMLASFDRNEIDDDAIEEVAPLYCDRARGPRNDRILMLSARVRVEVISRLLERGGRPELARVRNTIEPTDETPLQEMLDTFTLGVERAPLRQLNDDQLLAALTVSRWVVDAVALARLSHQIDLGFQIDEIEGLLAQREVTRPVRELASEGCVARETEMEKLNRYLSDPVYGTLSGDPAMTVYGIGGVGKSTLVASFVMQLVDAVHPANQHAWAYLDMDRPTLRSYRPQVILDEILRQTAAQHPAGRRGLEGRRQEIAQKSFGEGVEAAFDRSDLFYSALADLSESVSRWIPNPLVVVLDTFEEVEHTEPELRVEIYDMLERLSGAMPLKLIVSGRAPAEPFSLGSAGRTDRLLEVKEFEGPQALALLRHFLGKHPDPVRVDDDLGFEIVETVGGNPLTLKLAASVLAAEGTKGLNEAMNRALIVDRVRREFIRGFLYQRIIEHLQSSDPGETETLQAVARASLPLRMFTPDLISDVVLPAIGVQHPNPAWLHEELARTVAFARREGDRGWLRVDVRVPALRALRYQDQAMVDRVHRLAVAFYSERADDREALVELAFHRLELGEPVDDMALDPTDLSSLRDWTSHHSAMNEAVQTTDDKTTVRGLEAMYHARQAMGLAEQSLARDEVDAARAALDGVDQAVIDDLSMFDARMLMDLDWLDSRIYQAQDEWEAAIRSASRALDTANRIGDRTRYAAIAIWNASLREQTGNGVEALATLGRAADAKLLAGDHRLRLELLLNQITTMERTEMVDEDERWQLELRSRTLLNSIPPNSLETDTGLLRLLGATLGRDEPSRLKAAVTAVGLGTDEDPQQLRALAGRIAEWDRSGTESGRLARSIRIDIDPTLPAEDAWVAALAGMGREAGFSLATLWEVEEPPPDVREAIRAFYVHWGVKRVPVDTEAGRPHFLDETPIDFGREEARTLEQIVLDGYGKPESLARLADLAGIDPSSLNLSGRPQMVVRTFLTTASNKHRLRDVVRAMEEDTSLGTLRNQLDQLIAGSDTDALEA